MDRADGAAGVVDDADQVVVEAPVIGNRSVGVSCRNRSVCIERDQGVAGCSTGRVGGVGGVDAFSIRAAAGVAADCGARVGWASKRGCASQGEERQDNDAQGSVKTKLIVR